MFLSNSAISGLSRRHVLFIGVAASWAWRVFARSPPGLPMVCLCYDGFAEVVQIILIAATTAGPLTDFPGEISAFARVYLAGMQEIARLLDGIQVLHG